jgi:formylglycine-generating enzyme required for sulfatase activity
MRRCLGLIFALLSLCAGTGHAGIVTFGSGANSFNMEFVTIGDAGNAADTTGNPNPAGSVAYQYQIGKYEVTRGMIEAANSQGSLGIGLFDLSAYGGNDPDKPATGLSWYEAAIFVNWLNTSTGHQAAYKFVNGQFELWQPGDVGYDALNPFRNKLANYVLPTTNEWYKAAFYDGSSGVYYDYATGSDVAPISVLSGTASGTAVYGHSSSTGPTLVNLAGGESPYGTVGQSGNVYEWQETASDLVNDLATERRARSGGRYMSSASDTTSSTLGSLTPTSEFFSLGFRVASLSVPEPSTASVLGSMAFFGFSRGRHRRLLRRGKSYRRVKGEMCR